MLTHKHFSVFLQFDLSKIIWYQECCFVRLNSTKMSDENISEICHQERKADCSTYYYLVHKEASL
jgi:hypothetical protein